MHRRNLKGHLAACGGTEVGPPGLPTPEQLAAADATFLAMVESIHRQCELSVPTPESGTVVREAPHRFDDAATARETTTLDQLELRYDNQGRKEGWQYGVRLASGEFMPLRATDWDRLLNLHTRDFLVQRFARADNGYPVASSEYFLYRVWQAHRRRFTRRHCHLPAERHFCPLCCIEHLGQVVARGGDDSDDDAEGDDEEEVDDAEGRGPGCSAPRSRCGIRAVRVVRGRGTGRNETC